MLESFAVWSWYISMVRNSLFETLLQNSHTGLGHKAKLLLEILLPVQQVIRWSQACNLYDSVS